LKIHSFKNSKEVLALRMEDGRLRGYRRQKNWKYFLQKIGEEKRGWVFSSSDRALAYHA
jgi:hypothetical protein